MDRPRLIIIRGNSASGKSAIAKRLREELGGKVALVGQDALRRDILMEGDDLENTDVLGLLDQTINYCFYKEYDVILEGILGTQKYLPVIEKIISDNNCVVRAFYLDVSLEETIKRHQTKPVATEFSEDKLREWYKPDHYFGIEGEVIIPGESDLEDSVALIKESL